MYSGQTKTKWDVTQRANQNKVGCDTEGKPKQVGGDTEGKPSKWDVVFLCNYKSSPSKKAQNCMHHFL